MFFEYLNIRHDEPYVVNQLTWEMFEGRGGPLPYYSEKAAFTMANASSYTMALHASISPPLTKLLPP